MKLIDEELGGTTPLEVILKFPLTENERSLPPRMMSLKIGKTKKILMMKSIGLLKIKLIKLPLFTTI